jgi:hypothetical protein
LSVVKNANELFIKLQGIYNRYDTLVAPLLAKLRSRYTDAELDTFQPDLEAHRRCYLINDLLATLNWRLDTKADASLPNLVPEQALPSVEAGHTRFLDYLGFERETQSPLLIVEAKRLLDPPALASPDAATDSLSEVTVLARGLRGEKLKGQWSEWLGSLTDYVRSVTTRTGVTPARVMLTDGDIVFVFLDPADAFLSNRNCSTDRIVVFRLRQLTASTANGLFVALEYNEVACNIPLLTPAQLPFFVDPKDVNRAMHGLRVTYETISRIFSPSPMITFSPILLVGSRYGSWITVRGPDLDVEMEREYPRLKRQLENIRRMAGDLLLEVSAVLGSTPSLLSLREHYENEDSFQAHKGVRQVGNEYFIVTGTNTHYLLDPPVEPSCPHHDWAKSRELGLSTNPGPVLARSIDPRAFFISGESHHCTHRDVGAIKAEPIRPDNRERCGPRSGEDFEAFCEIWRFETHLCCRTCAFLEVCEKAQVFQLPCQRP